MSTPQSAQVSHTFHRRLEGCRRAWPRGCPPRPGSGPGAPTPSLLPPAWPGCRGWTLPPAHPGEASEQGIEPIHGDHDRRLFVKQPPAV
eukprot:2584108-Amphidinium_carterae.1